VQRVYLAYAITSRSANEQQSSRYLLNVLENPRHGLVDTANTGLSRLGSVFELALAAPEKMHVLEGGQTTAKTSHAITLTCAFEHEGQMAVLCGDLRDVGKSSHANVDVSHDMSPRSNAHNIISFQV
jgi:hypothetical protein